MSPGASQIFLGCSNFWIRKDVNTPVCHQSRPINNQQMELRAFSHFPPLLGYFENCGRICFFLRLIILLTDPILSHSPNFGRPKQGQTFVVPTFHIHFLNPECVRIPWVLAPKNFPIENFRVRSDLQKSSIFHWFLLPPPKKKYRARVPTILMPETFPIASLNRYTPNFSGVPLELT